MTGYTRFLVPLGLALAAAGANFVLLKKQIAKVEVLVVAADIAEGEAITADKLGVITVRADEKLFPNAFGPNNVGEVVDLTARRRLRAGEMLFRADVGESMLPPAAGEHSWLVNVRAERVAPLLVPGQSVFVYVNPPDAGSFDRSPRAFGPYRLLGWQKSVAANREPMRTYLLAVPDGDTTEPVARGWIAAARNSPDVVQAIELGSGVAAKRAASR